MKQAAGSAAALVTLRASALALAIQLLAPAVAHAQTAGAAVGGLGPWGYLGLVFNLGLVLVAIWAAVMAMRWYVRRVNGEVGGARQLQVLESRALGPNRSLHLVRLADRAVLLGVTADRINALLTVDDPAEVERMVAAAAGGGALRQAAAGVSGRVGISLGATPRPALLGEAWQALVRRVWTGPGPRRRIRPQPRTQAVLRTVTPEAPAQPTSPTTPPDVMGGAMQRANATAAYARSASIAAAQRAIAEARAADTR